MLVQSLLEGMPVKGVGKHNKLLDHYNDVNEDTIIDLVVGVSAHNRSFIILKIIDMKDIFIFKLIFIQNNMKFFKGLLRK
jgi:hypothetical protein